MIAGALLHLKTEKEFPVEFYEASMWFDGKKYSNRARRCWKQHPNVLEATNICEAYFRCSQYRAATPCGATMKLSITFLEDGIQKKACILGNKPHSCVDQKLIEQVSTSVPFIRDIREEMRKQVEELAISMPCEKAAVIADKVMEDFKVKYEGF